MNNQDQMKSMEDNIVNKINSLKDEIIHLKDIVIRNLQDISEKLQIDVNDWKNTAQSMSQTIMLWHRMVNRTT